VNHHESAGNALKRNSGKINVVGSGLGCSRRGCLGRDWEEGERRSSAPGVDDGGREKWRARGRKKRKKGFVFWTLN